MKVKLSILVDAVQPLQRLNNLDLPVETAYLISKNVQIINEELKAYNEIRNKLFKKYGEDIEEKGKKITRIKKENIKIFNEENNKLLTKMSNINLKKIELSALKGVKLRPSDISNLEFLLKV